MRSEAKKLNDARWKKANAVRIAFRLYKNTDADLIEFLEGVDNKQGLIKDLLRKHMEESK